MNSLIEFISQPWHWAVSGASFAFLVFSMTFLGRKFGMSGFYEAMCTAGGAGKYNDFFKKNIKEETWRLFFIIGTIGGGYIAANYLQSPDPVAISDATNLHLQEWNIDSSEGNGFLPDFFMSFSQKAIILAMLSGVFVGFGSRYGKGCTSGHAITGLSHLKKQSLFTIFGFFIGGLIVTWLVLPLLF